MFIELTQEQFEDLAENGEDADDWGELEEEICDDSLINGYSFELDRVNFSVSVGSTDRTDLAIKFLAETMQSVSESDVSSEGFDSHYLVFEKRSGSGVQTIEIDADFDPVLLDFMIDELEMPDGSFRKVINVTYDGDDFEFQSSWTKSEHMYLVGPDKKRVELG